MRFGIRTAAYLCLGALTVGSAVAQETPTTPLEAFGALAVGEWDASDSRHVLEWGVGRKIIHSKSYFRSGEQWTLVSEGIWYANPSGNGVLGLAVAIEMPVDLFEYHSEIRGDTIVHQLVSHGAMGGKYLETWQFVGDGYRWELEQDKDGVMQRVMGGAYRRAE